MKWTEREYQGFIPYQEILVEDYQKLGFSKIMSEVMVKREMDYSTVERLLNNPNKCLTAADKLFGLEGVAKEIVKLKGRRFFVFADYDVDGLTAGYIMTKYLERQGYLVSVYYPQRSEGYGLSRSFVEKNCECGDVIITVDNGITAHEAVRVAEDIGITVLVTDHHKPGETLPKCKICDPQLGDFGHNLCGAAVVLKVCQKLDELMGTNFWWQYVPYAALGTISDVMPMDIENMAIVKAGIKLMKKCAPNVWEMVQAFGDKQITTEVLAWKIIPRLNACGRLENIELAKDFFFEEADISNIILRIDNLNEQRKKITDKAIREAMKKDYSADTFCLFDATDYPAGIVGLIAGKLSEQYGRPAIVYHRNNTNIWSGSVRSSTIDILSYLKRLQEKGIIFSCAGHSHACAISLFSDIETFRKTLNGYLRTIVIEAVEKQIIIDSEISFNDITQKLLEDTRVLPTDKDLWPEPVFVIRGLKVSGVTFSNNNKNNVKFSLVDKNRVLLDLWAWGLAPLYEKMGRPDTIDIVGKITNMGYGRNKEVATFTIEDIKESDEV